MQKPLWWIKWTKYEYWPVWFFFLPFIFIAWPVLAIRSRALLYFTATNPGIPLGGFFGEKKYDIIKHIDQKYLPKTLLITKEAVKQSFETITSAFSFPFIIKPNVGERGSGVQKINTAEELETYLQACEHDIIIQEFITHPEEYGVMFYKYPDGSANGITSIVKKGFLTVAGDGKNTVAQLLEGNERARFQMPLLRETKADLLETVIPEGEKKLVQPIGNHCLGTRFINANHLITPTMVEAFNKISDGIPGFYFGRFDIKAASDEDLQQGKTIKVMEVNGTTSEPGHIYDMETMTLWKAWRDVWRGMYIICTIGMMNHRNFKVPYTSPKEFLSILYGHFVSRKR